MKIWSRLLPRLIALGVICIIALFSYEKPQASPTHAEYSKSNTVIIDAGHAALENTID